LIGAKRFLQTQNLLPWLPWLPWLCPIQQAIRSLAKVYSLLLPASENLKRDFPRDFPRRDLDDVFSPSNTANLGGKMKTLLTSHGLQHLQHLQHLQLKQPTESPT
jgi:hypothetical protein